MSQSKHYQRRNILFYVLLDLNKLITNNVRPERIATNHLINHESGYRIKMIKNSVTQVSMDGKNNIMATFDLLTSSIVCIAAVSICNKPLGFHGDP